MKAEPSAAATATLRVLLVDDDETMRDVGIAMLEALGADEVQTARNGEEGLKLLGGAAIMPNLLLCDLQMPGMDGIEFLRHVAMGGYRGDVVLLSGMTHGVLKASEQLAREHGLHLIGVLEKPLTEARLAAVLAQASRERAAAEASGAAQALTPAEIQAGLREGRLEAHFQPIVSLRDGRVLGAEALARWRDPVRGLLPPFAFIPVAESHGLIHAITLEMFRQAVARQQAWRQDGHRLAVHVDITVDDLLDIELPALLHRLVDDAGLTVGDFVLELTEGRLMSDLKRGLDVLIRLRLKGFGLAIDDFGIGYSTMETLLRLPFTELKVDRAFVCGAHESQEARAILDSSVKLGRTFGLTVVAEGVETRADWACARAAGCDAAQGFLVAVPMPGDALGEWITRWHAQGDVLPP
jgi:EAL domain-containing protein (putative c-di-GMP-specific phosphodiesterase class I)